MSNYTLRLTHGAWWALGSAVTDEWNDSSINDLYQGHWWNAQERAVNEVYEITADAESLLSDINHFLSKKDYYLGEDLINQQELNEVYLGKKNLEASIGA
jgi:hypothetical protein